MRNRERVGILCEDVDGDHFEGRLTRASALRFAAAGAAGLALGVRPVRAASSRAASLESAARAFLASLSPTGRERATFPFADAERTRWHWTVPASVPRNGLPFGAMSAGQRSLALALLRASCSARGYRKALDIIALQGVLQRMDTGLTDPFDPNRYYVSVFGTPGSRVWGWRLEGHHLSRHFTVVGGKLAAEPFFLGAWPTRAGSAYRSVARGYRTMPREEDAAREIVLSVDGRLRRQVVFSPSSLTDHLTQNAVRVRPLEPVGVLTRDLPSAAQRRVHEIVHTYLANHPPAIARDALARIERAGGLGRTRFGWAGSTRPGQPHYYRLQGPRFVLEFDNSRNSGTHIHSVWRDFERDFGRHLL
jgi:Protein of unknown function (DUF3500)